MTDISRRDALIAGAVGSLATLLRAPQAAARDAVRTALPVPPEIRPDAHGVIAFSAQAGTQRFVPAAPTATFGYEGAFLGPALRLRRGQTVAMNFTNRLPEPTTVHWHGLVIPGAVDGGPHRPIPPGGTWQPILPIDQPAATLWFHPHFYPTTAAQVTKGLAGLLIVDDENTDQLPLPKRWGIDDIPLIIQDRRFQQDGSFFDRMNLTAVTNGYVGDVALVNGAQYPLARTARGWVRLRLLDGSNARSYVLGASDGRPLFVIGSDGGLLERPVEMKQITIHAGERFEVMVDCRSGVAFDLLAFPTGQPIMRLPPFDRPVPLATIQPGGAAGDSRLPDALAPMPPIPVTLPAISQELVMTMFRDMEGMAPLMRAGLGMQMGGSPMGGMAMAMNNMGMHNMGSHGTGAIAPDVVARVVRLIEDQPALSRAAQLSANGVNGKPYALGETGFSAERGEALRWRISEGHDMMPHPVHIHGCQFRIVSQNGTQPEAYRAGWKDTAPISDAGFSEILVTFPHAADAEMPYMAHCHILEHEDSGMMTQFTVS